MAAAKTADKIATSKDDRIFAGLDIGCSKVAVIIGQENHQTKEIDIVGLGSVSCTGVRKGVVVNIESTTEAIRKAKEEAELMAGISIARVFVSIGGGHIKSFDSRGMIAVANHEVGAADVARVIEAAKAVSVPSDREVLHVLPKEFKVDEQDGINDPIGMNGVRLEASVHIVTGGITALQNTVKCTRNAGLEVIGFVLQPLASALAVLSEDEKKLGAAIADIGSGTTDIVVYHQGSISFTKSLPVGGSHITNDVAVGMRTPQGNAEQIKKKYGSALADLVDPSELIEIEGVGGRNARSVHRKDLCDVIEPRTEEILNMIASSIYESGLAPLLGSGVILTGGSSQLHGITDLGEFVLDMPVRRGLVNKLGGLSETVKSPAYATAVGLLFYAQNQPNAEAIREEEDLSFFAGIRNRVKRMFMESTQA